MITRPVLTLILAVHLTSIGFAEVSVDQLFTDGMVLQRGIDVVVRGEGKGGSDLTLKFKGQVKRTSVGQDGQWSITLDPLQASTESAELTIIAGESTIELRDVVVGDVWLCSGQSNMGFKLKACTGGKEAADASMDPLLRVNKLRDTWKPCTGETAATTSGVAFFFGRKLRQDNPGVPVGIIVRALSGSPIEAWTPVEALNTIDFCRQTMERFGPESEEGGKYLAFQAAEAKRKRARRKNGDDKKAAGKKPAFDGSAEDLVLAGIYGAGLPGRLWAGRIEPVVGFGIKGVIWYQGERNTKAGDACAAQYTNMLPAMITAWRKAWGLGDFRFLVVQLPPFAKGGANWKVVQKGQASGVSKVKNAACVDTSDLPDGGLHPTGKLPIGERLALQASE